MKKNIALWLILLMFANCAKFRYRKLTPSIQFTIPAGEDINYVRVIQSSDYLFELPSEYYIKKRQLYLVDIFNYRVLKINRKNRIVLNFGEKYEKKEFNLFSTNFNGIEYNNSLFKFVEPGQVCVDNENNILVENVLSSMTEEHKYNAYSIILKFNNSGEALEIYGKKKTDENIIYPFEELDHFSVDKNNNLFIFEKKEKNWKIHKYSVSQQPEKSIDSTVILDKIRINENENAVVENIDHSYTGDFLIASVNFYKKDYQFIKSNFYKVFFSGKIYKLFSLKDEEYNFILVNNSDIIYLWKTEERDGIEERIILRLVNLNGKVIANKVLKLERTNAKWFNIKIQKDDIISGINLSDSCFNVVVWN